MLPNCPASSARSISMSRPRSSQWMVNFLTWTPLISSLGMGEGSGVGVQGSGLSDDAAGQLRAVSGIGPFVLGLWRSGRNLGIELGGPADDPAAEQRLVRVQ